MIRLTVKITIDRSLEEVYLAYTDPGNMIKWTSDLEYFEVIKGEFGIPGSIAKLHYNQNGRKSILEDKLEYLIPEVKIVSQVSGEGLIVKVETLFSTTDEGSVLTLNWNGTSNNLIARFILNLVKRKIKKRIQSDLYIFKQLVEEYGIKFP